MTLDKAIELLKLDLTYTYPARFDDLQDAIKLGGEALKRVLRARNPANPPEPLLLPGEDPE